MRKFGFIATLIVGGLLLLSPILVLGATNDVGGSKEEIDALNKQIDARKDKIKQLEETMAKTKKVIDEKRLQAVSLKNQLSILDNRMVQIQTDIDMTKEKISQAELEIEALELSIQDKEAVIAKQKKIIGKMIQGIHAEDQKNYLEIALTNDSFADFYNQLKYLENVYIDLGRSVKTLRLSKEDLEAKKQEVDNRRLTYTKLKSDLDNKMKDLTDQSNLKSAILVETHSSELRFRSLLETQRQQYQAIENEMNAFESQLRKKLAEEDKLGNLAGGPLSWPLSTRYITASFHDPDYPFQNVFAHSGIDIRASQGTPVKAAAAGYVARAKRCTSASCYSYILIVHTGNISTVYGHLSGIQVSEDQFVSRGDVIGYSGGTPGTVGAGPFVTGPHLHFEVRQNGIPVDPMNFLIQ